MSIIEQPSVTVTGDSRVDHNLLSLAIAIVKSPLIASFVSAVDTLNKDISVTDSVTGIMGEGIASPETLKALLVLSELNKIRSTYLKDAAEMIQEFTQLGGDRLQQVLLHHFTPMGVYSSTATIKQLPPAIEIWVRPDVYAPQFAAVREAIKAGYLLTNGVTNPEDLI